MSLRDLIVQKRAKRSFGPNRLEFRWRSAVWQFRQAWKARNESDLHRDYARGCLRDIRELREAYYAEI